MTDFPGLARIIVRAAFAIRRPSVMNTEGETPRSPLFIAFKTTNKSKSDFNAKNAKIFDREVNGS